MKKKQYNNLGDSSPAQRRPRTKAQKTERRYGNTNIIE
jgi:hypothetical protein